MTAGASAVSVIERFGRGSFALVIRQGFGALIGLAGIMLVAAAVGPEAYGVYIAALAAVGIILPLAQAGMGLALVRSPQPPSPRECAVVHSLLIALAAAGLIGGGGLLAAFFLGWGTPEPLVPALAMLAVGMLALPATVPLALLEREQRYPLIAFVELVGALVWLGVAWLTATHGCGRWSLPLGWLVQQSWLAAAWYGFTRYQPTWAWDGAICQGYWRFGRDYSLSVVVWQVRSLVAPAVVGPTLGLPTVGQIGFAERMVEALGVGRQAAWRAGAPVLGRFQHDPARIADLLGLAAAATALVTGGLLVGLTLARPLLGAWFGARWDAAFTLIPVLGLHSLAASLAVLVTLFLHIIGRSRWVTLFQLVHIAVLWTLATILVPRLGLAGWIWAQAVAVAPFALLLLGIPGGIRQQIRGLVPAAGCALVIAGFLLWPGWPLAGPLAVALAWLAWRTWTGWQLLARSLA